jgi:hypothetical protein
MKGCRIKKSRYLLITKHKPNTNYKIMNFKNWIVDLFKDERGSTSIKPVIAFLGALFLCSTMMINSFTHGDIKPSPDLVNAVMIITAIGMGADTLDKFSHKKKDDSLEG